MTSEPIQELADREKRALADVPVPVHPDARAGIVAARRALDDELDDLGAALRSAVDVPAKIRRHPVRTAALAGSGLFMVVGGPRRVLRGVAGRVRRRPAPARLLPEEVVRVIDTLGVRDDEVRGALERGFADYLTGKPKTVRRGPGQTLWRLLDEVSFFLAPALAKRIADRLFAAEPDRPRGTPTRPSTSSGGGPPAS